MAENERLSLGAKETLAQQKAALEEAERVLRRFAKKLNELEARLDALP